MKKLLIFAVCAVVSFGASAMALYIATCGEKTYTIAPEHFDSQEEAEEYYRELDAALCGY